MNNSVLKRITSSLIPLFLAGALLLVTVSIVRGQALTSSPEARSAADPLMQAKALPLSRFHRETEPPAADTPPQPFTPPGPWPSPDMAREQPQSQSGGGYPPGWQRALEQGVSPPAWLDEAMGTGSSLDWGGPDPFGYTYADSDDPWGPDPTFEDISGVGSAITFTGFYYTATLPFAFPFYTDTHTLIYLYSDCLECWNDWTHLAFGAPDPWSYGAVYWMDNIDRDSGSIYIYSDTVSSPARFIVQYDEVWNYSYGITTTSQVILYENGDILVRYAGDFSWWNGWYWGGGVPWLNRWYGPFYYAGTIQSDFAVQFYYPEGAWLWPPEQGGGGPLGGEAVYAFDLSNDTGAADGFAITAGGNLWPTTVSPTQTGVIADGGVVPITVRVDIPPGATPGDTDAAAIQATSVTSPSLSSDTVTISTTAVCSPALVFSGQSAQTYGDLDDTYDYGGQRFTYIYVNGFSEDNDSLDATVSGYDPDADLWQTIVQQWDGSSGIVFNHAFVPPAYSRVRVQLDDWEDNDLIYYDYRLIVCREPAVMLNPSWQQSLAQADTTAVYTQTLTNYMMNSDSFDLSVSGNDWPTSFWDGPTQISNTGALTDLETFTFTVRVEVPGDVTLQDTAIIQATSVADPGVASAASLNTVLLAFPWAQAYGENWAPDGSTDPEQYLDIVRPSGVGTVQVTNDGEWQDGPPALAAYPREAIVAAWTGPQRWNNTTNYTNIEYAAFDVNGKTVVSVTQVSDNISATIYTYDYSPAPAVAPTDGNVLITWQRYEDDWTGNYRNNIYYAVRGPDGGEVLTPTALTTNTDQSDEDSYPSAAAFDDGRFALTWRHWVSATGTADIYYAVLDSSGDLLAGPINLTNNSEPGWIYPPPHANRLADNKVILTWTSQSWMIDYAVLDSTGDLAYPVSRLSYEYGAGYADAVGLRNGNTIVAWLQWGGPEWMPQIAYAVLNSEYTTTVPISEAMRILTNTLTNDNHDISLARDVADNAVFTWEGDDLNIFYGVVDNAGEVRTWPMVFHPGQGYLRVNGGAGNGGLPEPALSITKTASPEPVAAGGLLTYTILVENTGFAEATGVTISDTLPENTTFVSADSGGTLAGDQVRWTGLTVSAGGSLVVQFVVRVSDTLPDGSILVNDDYGVRCAEATTVVMGKAVSTTVMIEEWHVYLPVVVK